MGCTCVIVQQSVGAARRLPPLVFRLHRFRKANGTITKLVLERNKTGDAGASALAESLRATFVTCVLQIRASQFLWPVRTQFRRRRSATVAQQR